MTREQLELFGAPDEKELKELALAIPPHVRFGTSSWTFEGWKNIVYRRAYANKQAFVRDSLAEYARYPLFSTVGIDRSYYAPLGRQELDAYAAMLPPGFRCCMKVWNEIGTPVFPRHEHYGARAGKINPAFLDPIVFTEQIALPLAEHFDAHIGPLIFEVPSAPIDVVPFVRAIERFLSHAPEGFHYAFEVRQPTLLNDEYLAVLRAHPHASHVLNFQTRMPTLRAQLDKGVLMHGLAVVRLMIPPAHRYAARRDAYAPFDRLVEPQPAMREDVLRAIDECAARGMTVYVLVNNKVEGSSPLTVRALCELLRDSTGAR